VADAIDFASVCLLDTSDFEIKINQHDGSTNRPLSPSAGADRPWLHDELTGHLHATASDNIQVRYKGQEAGHTDSAAARETLAQGSSAGTPYRFFQQSGAGRPDAMARAIQSSLSDGQRWWSSTNIEDTYLIDHLDRPAGSSRHVLLVPAWGSQGYPALLLAIAFDTMPADQPEIEAFVKNIMIGVVNRLSLRRAQTFEREDETFLAMQPHELRTPLHHL